MSFRNKAAAYFSYLMQDVPHSGLDRAVLYGLGGISRLYKKIIEIKYRPFANGQKTKTKLPVVVISFGNITVGGTGKTPAACMLARRLQALGRHVVLLNRGYRSSTEHQTTVMSDGTHIFLTAAEGGDEAYLLARSLPGIPVVVGRDRIAAGMLAIERFNADVLILDDAFQYWKLDRDLDIVLVDATNPFGNGYMLPRGILREPPEHLSRAGLFLITKADQRGTVDIERIYRDLRRYNDAAPIAEAIHRAGWCIPFSVWCSAGKIDYTPYEQGKGKAIAVSALGNPVSFEDTVRLFGYEMIDSIRFDDHHQYTSDEVRNMTDQAKAAGAVLITTEKDAVKLSESDLQQYNTPLYVLGIEIEITKGQDAIYTLLRTVLGG